MLHASELACLSAANLESLAKELRNVCKMLADETNVVERVGERANARPVILVADDKRDVMRFRSAIPFLLFLVIACLLGQTRAERRIAVVRSEASASKCSGRS